MQEIVNVRIDERLIHGQVAAMWTNVLKATRIMVVDDMASQDEIQKVALKMACPAGIKLSILNCEKAVNNLKDNKYDGDRVFMVIKGPETLIEMVKFGWSFTEVNVGNMSSGFGTRQVGRSVNVTEEDVTHFEDWDKLGVVFYSQMVPNYERIDFMKTLRK